MSSLLMRLIPTIVGRLFYSLVEEREDHEYHLQSMQEEKVISPLRVRLIVGGSFGSRMILLKSFG